MKKIIIMTWLSILLLTSCNQATGIIPNNETTTAKIVTPRPTWTAIKQNTPRPTLTLAPTETPFPPINSLPSFFAPNPISISIETSDGITLRGYFYPAARKNAPVVVMMHQHEGDQSLWHLEDSGFVSWLQNWQLDNRNTPTPSANGSLAAVNPVLTFNVLTFDFRGHGESYGGISQDFSTFLIDARAAYQAARALPDVNAERIIGIGTSIGANAAIRACDEAYCRGVFAISPANWTGTDFAQTVSSMTSEGKQVRCMYSAKDDPSPTVCWSPSANKNYKIFEYPGLKHGMSFFVPRKMEPDFGKNIIEFLFDATQ